MQLVQLETDTALAALATDLEDLRLHLEKPSETLHDVSSATTKDMLGQIDESYVNI